MALEQQRVVVLVGGVGGAKLALGLQGILSPENLTIIVNTGDDFWHYGLRVCPDVDTLLYTLSGRVNKEWGWGLADDTTTTLEALRAYGEDAWFRLGDRDIATHLLRTDRLRHGETLTQIVAYLARQMGIDAQVLPMSDAFIETKVNTREHGELDFQEYFVRHRWQPHVTSLRYEGAEEATPTQSVLSAIAQADLLLIAPSNPWLSIAPMLAMPAMRDALRARAIPRVAITPIVGGQAIKGPAAKLMGELGFEVSATSVARYYGDVINGFVQDARDEMANLDSLISVAFDTIMSTDEDKMRLAKQILAWVQSWEKTV